MAPHPLPQNWLSSFLHHTILQCHPAMAPTIAHYNGTLPWHPAMAPRPQSCSSPSPPTIPRYNGTPRWHPAMAPRPLPQSWSSPSPANHFTLLPSPHHSTLQWHPAMAPRPLQLVVTLPPNHSTLQWQPTMAPAWCHVQSAKVVRRPPPFLEVRTPHSYRYLGK